MLTGLGDGVHAKRIGRRNACKQDWETQYVLTGLGDTIRANRTGRRSTC